MSIPAVQPATFVYCAIRDALPHRGSVTGGRAAAIRPRCGALSIKGRRRGPCAFTLVELLVSIAIIALLMAILLAALRGPRQAARMTVCMANMHNAALALSGYVSESNDYLPDGPPLGWAGRPTGIDPWASAGGAIPSEQRRLHHYGATDATMRCPADKGDFVRMDGVSTTSASGRMLESAGACYGTTVSRGGFPFLGYARRSGVHLPHWPDRNNRFVFAEVTFFAFTNPTVIDAERARWHVVDDFSGTAVMGDWSARLLRKSTYDRD
jgi:prepilin-type N-terminal cleavage/methylation domain-containing protein